jgi:hypothetical protein
MLRTIAKVISAWLIKRPIAKNSPNGVKIKPWITKIFFSALAA